MYFIDDPLTPELTEEPVVPTEPTLPFVFDQEHVGCKITLYRSVNYYQSIADAPLANWVRKKPLQIIPFAGKDLNAFYNRKSLSFFGKGDVQTANSSDVVAHELGHALLDALRPDFWNVQSLEIWAFHESWSDIVAIVSILQSDKLIDHILKETGGNLHLSNTASRIAAQIGHVEYGRNYLRDAAIRFNYMIPTRLPKKAAEDKLSSESHSFSRVFASAWYEFFVRLYEKLGGGKEALKTARDHAFKCLWKAAKVTPATVRFFGILTKNIAAANHHNVAASVFQEWKLIQPQIRMLSNQTLSDFHQKPTDQVVATDSGTIIHRKSKALFKLSDHVVTALAANPLADVKIEIPNDSYFEFDGEGKLVEEIVPSLDEIVESSVFCLSHVKTGRNQMWRIKNRKLERSRI
jgi:hypothetical protein